MPDYIKYNPLSGRILNKWLSVDPSVVAGESDILEIPRSVFESLTKYRKVDNGQVVEMTAAEKSALDLEEAQERQAERQAEIDVIDDRFTAVQTISLTKVENAIDNIGNLNDAKVFLKRLCRYIATFSCS